MKLLTLLKRWIVPGSIIFAFVVLCSLFSSEIHSTGSKMVSMGAKGGYFGPKSFTQRYNTANIVTMALVVCGTEARMEQAITMLKSAVLFTRVKLDLHIFVDDHLQMLFRNKLSRWPQKILKNLSYHIHNISFPDDVVGHKNDNRGWREFFRPCATQRLFFPSLLAEVDSLIYVDTDTLFLSPPEDLWNYFSQFNTSQEMAATNSRKASQYNYPTHFIKGLPVLRKNEINSGVMLFNLTRMRVSKFDKYVYQYRKQYGSSLRGDQDILSIYRYNYPDRMYIFPCEWNYRVKFCSKHIEERCLEAEENGARVVHGTRHVFDKEVKTMWQVIHKAFEKFDLGQNVVSDLIPLVENSMDQVKYKQCRTSIFMNQIYERSRSALTKDGY